MLGAVVKGHFETLRPANVKLHLKVLCKLNVAPLLPRRLRDAQRTPGRPSDARAIAPDVHGGHPRRRIAGGHVRRPQRIGPPGVLHLTRRALDQHAVDDGGAAASHALLGQHARLVAEVQHGVAGARAAVRLRQIPGRHVQSQQRGRRQRGVRGARGAQRHVGQNGDVSGRRRGGAHLGHGDAKQRVYAPRARALARARRHFSAARGSRAHVQRASGCAVACARRAHATAQP
ncbi:HTR-like protein [Gracilaria domingensis]|nr:HTR-like protein [Gracilaria domingensis]